MNYTDLKNWSKLTTEEKERLKYVFGSRSPKITKTLHDLPKDSMQTSEAEDNE